MAAIRAFADSDHAFVAWRVDAPIPGCRGFALKRRSSDPRDAVEVLDTWVGFVGDTAPSGTKRPSTSWPIQRFLWSDYAPPRDRQLSYQAVPMVGEKDALHEDAAHATGWSDPVAVTEDCGDGVSAYFNRGIVATQWLARALRERGGEDRKTLTGIIETPGDKVRRFLGGAVLRRLPLLLADTLKAGGEIHAALFELDDPQLLDALKAFGPKAHVILANGADAPGDENADARHALEQAGVEVLDRMVKKGHFAHNKFLVCSTKDGSASVWTGSTNWTTTGLCTQSNNAILIEGNPDLAGWFLDEWTALKSAGDAYPATLKSGNSAVRTTTLGRDGASAQIWFAPVDKTVDLDSARERIDHATDGILFLMFNPGPQGTLLNDIVARTRPESPTYDANLHVHGVLNQDPQTTSHPIIGLFHRGERTDADIDVVLPARIDSDFGFWLSELSYSMVMVHSKCIVVDPFGAKPAVITGSHNLGPKASGKNDDNLLIVDNQRKLAEAYAVYIMGVYNQYRWRYHQHQAEQGKEPATHTETDTAPTWAGLVDDDAWQSPYFMPGPEQRELDFWLPAPIEGTRRRREHEAVAAR